MKSIMIIIGMLLVTTLQGCQQLNNSTGASSSGLVQPWPPVIGQAYPDLTLTDTRGEKVKLSKFKGAVLLIEPIGMSCAACNAFSGAGDGYIKGFKGTEPQPGLLSIESYLPKYSQGVRLDDPHIIYISLILYNASLQPPTLAEAQDWSQHFQHSAKPNRVVLFADASFIGPASFAMIPGFHLVDANFVLRSDASGHNPRNDLFRDLLPMLGDLVRQKRLTSHNQTTADGVASADLAYDTSYGVTQ
ncbi:MAG: hypothetical protein HY231_11050 [Acidobacteria bacterium]|nr:hypothetical protein [Acidobacteriota bacterium]